MGDKYSFLSFMHTCVTFGAHFWFSLSVQKSRSITLRASLLYPHYRSDSAVSWPLP